MSDCMACCWRVSGIVVSNLDLNFNVLLVFVLGLKWWNIWVTSGLIMGRRWVYDNCVFVCIMLTDLLLRGFRVSATPHTVVILTQRSANTIKSDHSLYIQTMQQSHWFLWWWGQQKRSNRLNGFALHFLLVFSWLLPFAVSIHWRGVSK